MSQTGIWGTPGLEDRLFALTTQRLSHEAIATRLSEEFDITIPTTAVKSKIMRLRSKELVSRKGALIPRALVEPTNGFAKDVRIEKPKHPTGWEPHVEITGDEGTLISAPMEKENVTEEELLAGSQLDPKTWKIAGPIGFRKWETTVANRAPDGTFLGFESKWNWYYRAQLVKRDPLERKADVETLIRQIQSYKPRKADAPKGTVAFAVAIADLQIGKDDGDGVGGTVQRFQDTIERVKERAKNLRKMGVPIGPLYLLGLGDLIEGCSSDWYAQQTFRVQLDRREQEKVARRLFLHTVRELAPKFEKVVVAAIGGNHGENRKDGASFTSFGDNADVSLVETVEEIISENQDAFSHVSFSIPNDRLDMTLDICGTVTGIAHGHQFGKGMGAARKAEEWWKGQAHGGQPIGDASLLISGHYHHFLLTQMGRKTHIQAPAMEGGSEWYRNVTGMESPPGMLTLTIGKEHTRGWDNIAIL